MTREQIERASATMKESQNYHMSFEDAQDYISKCGFDIPWNDGDVFVDEREITRTVGNVLKWRINSVWHDVTNIPKKGEHIVIVFRSGNFASWNVSYNIADVFKKFDIILWSYSKDLLPERKEKNEMNREIIFRGKSLVTNEWVYGSLVKCGNENHIIGFDEVDLDGHHIRYYSDRPVFTKQGTIGQFTGLYDKNGKEIYEGDILMCIGQREDNKGRKYLRKVSFKNGSFCMGVPEYNIDSYLNNHIVNGKLNWEVIGNIYDNKELLEETK